MVTLLAAAVVLLFVVHLASARKPLLMPVHARRMQRSRPARRVGHD